MTHVYKYPLVLAVYPTARGFSFVIFESALAPLDWGVKETRGQEKNKKTLDAITDLIELYRPHVLVFEKLPAKGSKRSPRIRHLYRSLIGIAIRELVLVQRYSKEEIRSVFRDHPTKYSIACAIAKHIPAFAHRVPRFRKPWMSEDPRQSLFDAAALGITHYTVTLRSERDAPSP